ncbi:MAG: hypothetical protein ACKOJI_01955, partial [Phycisphaerales bacterium]
MPGGLHLWTGEPSAEATPRSLAGGDIRDVRGRRHIPLFRRKGAADVGAIDFVTPIMLWSLNDTKSAWNTTDGQPSGTVWMLMPAGAHPQTVARTLERTLRMPPHAPAVGVTVTQSSAMPAVTVGGDVNRYAVPPAVTAATAGDPPKCPRCSHQLGDVPDGPWWEPLPRDVRCPECGLLAPAGAVVLTGWRHAGQAMLRGANRRRGWMIGLLIAVLGGFMVPGNAGGMFTAILAVTIPASIGVGWLLWRAHRVRAAKVATWTAGPGELRIDLADGRRPDAAVRGRAHPAPRLHEVAAVAHDGRPMLV